MADKKMLGDFIYELRKEKGLSQAELGDLCGVNNKAVSKWETGEANPDLSVIQPLSGALGVTADELLRCERSPAPNDGPKQEAGSGSARYAPVTIKQFFSSLEYTSEKKTAKGTPFVHINFSSFRQAHGVIAIGFNAKGIISIGLFARGVVSIGILPLGLLSFGSFALGLLAAFGAVALGGVAVGGVAVGVIAIGGVAVGVYALGGAAIGWWAMTGEDGYALGENIKIFTKSLLQRFH